jgi:hypothetical protein
MKPAPLQLGEAPSELALNGTGFTRLALRTTTDMLNDACLHASRLQPRARS